MDRSLRPKLWTFSLNMKVSGMLAVLYWYGCRWHSEEVHWGVEVMATAGRVTS